MLRIIIAMSVPPAAKACRTILAWLGQWRLIGPRLTGTFVFLALRMRLSRARIREFFI